MRTSCPYCQHELLLDFVCSKTCKKCGTTKLLDEFDVQTMNRNGKSCYCLQCEAEIIEMVAANVEEERT